jgi:hypothetical protein
LILVLLLYALGRGNASQKLQKSWVIKALHDYLHQVAEAVSPLAPPEAFDLAHAEGGF